MPEDLRTRGDLIFALIRAVTGVTLPTERIELDRIALLRDRRERWRIIDHQDPTLGQLLGAVDLWLTRFDQWRRTGAIRQRGGSVAPPSSATDELREALLAYLRAAFPEVGGASRRRADKQREADADAFIASTRSSDDEW